MKDSHVCRLPGRKELLRQYILGRFHQERNEQRFTAHLPKCFACNALIERINSGRVALESIGLRMSILPSRPAE